MKSLITLLVLLSLSAQAQWKATSGPGGSAIQTMIESNGVLYVGTQGNGLFCSRDKGVSWQALNNGLTSFSIKAIAIKDQTMLVGTETGGVFRSTTGGQSWSPANSGLTFGDVSALVLNGSEIFLGSWGKGVFRSKDEGRTWEDVNQGLALTHIYKFLVRNQDVYVASGLKLFRWRGSKMELLSDLIGPIYGMAQDSNSIYLATYNGIYKSPDEGATWNFTRTNEPNGEIQIFGNLLFRGTQAGVFISQDAGKTWNNLNAGLADNGAVSFVQIGSSYFVASTDARVYVTDRLWQTVATVSATNYASELAPDSIGTIFGASMATTTAVAATVPLPETLAGVSVTIQDHLGNQIRCPLFFVSPQQINFQVPPTVFPGFVWLVVSRPNTEPLAGDLQIQRISPGLFTANGNGQGVPAGVALRIKPNGAQSYEPIARYDNATARFVPLAVDLSITTDKVFLILFGSGWRSGQNLTNAFIILGGTGATVTYAGLSPGLIGVDQINLALDKSLRPSSEREMSLEMMIENIRLNPVRIRLK